MFRTIKVQKLATVFQIVCYENVLNKDYKFWVDK